MNVVGMDAATEGAPLSWRIRERPGVTTVEFVGEIDENADFADLRRRLRGPVAFQLGEVRRINSCGVREWVNFVRDLPHVTDLSFSHCSPAIVTQLNMIYNFRGRAKIRSFYAPYVCDACGREEEQLIDVPTQAGLSPRTGAGRPTLPNFACVECQAPMEFDDLPERYLSFLAEA